MVDADAEAAGAARLQPHGDAVEAGIWLSRAPRGRGIGTRALLVSARAALTFEGDAVTAELPLG